MKRALLIVFLIITLAACQTAPAGTPTLSLAPTLHITDTPLPAVTATTIQTTVPAPTVSPDILKEQASPLCEKSFSALFEKGRLISPFAVMKKETYAEAPAWDISHPLPHMGSLSSAEVHTVFCISESRTQTGTYTDGSAAYQFFWEVRAVSFPEGRVIGRNSFAGSPPPKTKTSGAGAGEESFPYQEFAAWIFNQVDHPDFLYFNDAITSLALSPNGNVAAFGTAIANQIVDSDYQAKIFLFNPSDLQTDLGTSAYLDVLDGHQGMVTSLAFSPDGNMLASSGYDLFVKFWDVTTGALLGQISLADTPNSLAFSPDGTKLAVASNLEISFVNPVSMQIEQSIPEASGGNLAFAPDGNHLFVAAPFQITVIDTNAGTVTLKFPDPSTLVPTLIVAADGSVVGVTYASPDTVDNFVLSSDGTEIITYTVDRSIDSQSGTDNIRLATWDARTGKYQSETKFAGDLIGAIRLSPDGSLLAMANDQVVWLWDTESWQIVRNYSGHTDLIEHLVFTPGGEKILSASRDGTIRVWSVAE